MIWGCPLALRVSRPLASACSPARLPCRHSWTGARGHRQPRAGGGSRPPAAAGSPADRRPRGRAQARGRGRPLAAAPGQTAELRGPQQAGAEGRFFQQQPHPGGRQFVVEISPQKASMGRQKSGKAGSHAKAGACYLQARAAGSHVGHLRLVRARPEPGAHVQVMGLGTDTGLCTPSVLLFFDQHRCGHGGGQPPRARAGRSL